MQEIKYLIFDFDGVIGDTKDASAKATAIVDSVEYEVALASNQKYAHNKPSHTRNHTLTDAQMKEIYDWTVQFGVLMKESSFALFEDFVKEIELIENARIAVVSSGSQQYVIPALAQTNINPTHILAFENHHSKEEKIETICRDWGVLVSDVYYFTDTLADVYELRDFISKDKLIGVSWGYCGKDALLRELDEKYILNKAKDIHKVLTF
jgi:phosphoglycolate phosphatase-like HAD superfamily hydrolase